MLRRDARQKLSRRPWRVDTLDQLSQAWINGAQNADEPGSVVSSPYRRVVMFVDNAGADVVLGMLPFARELLRMGADVIIAANSQPAINDITAPELVRLLDAAGQICPILTVRP